MSGAIDPDEVDQWLPQTQCQRCGFPRCLEYAVSVAAGKSALNRCPPGGAATLNGLSRITGEPVTAIDPECGEAGPRSSAVIDEELCIGCTLCIQVCPVDAITGTSRLMHTVITQECTGCELCIEPCPMDCIRMVPCPPSRCNTPSPWPGYSVADVGLARKRAEARILRLENAARPDHHRPALERDVLRRHVLESVSRVRNRRRQTSLRRHSR